LTHQASSLSEPLPSEAFRARIDVTAPRSVITNSKFVTRVQIANQSQLFWPVNGLPSTKFRLRLSCQWLAPGSEEDGSKPVSNEYSAFGPDRGAAVFAAN